MNGSNQKFSKKPFFSILLPTYNAGNDILRCIDSIFKSTYQNFEIIIRDDCSTDGTFSKLKLLKKKHKKIILKKNKKNLGYPKNIFLCNQDAKGKYIFSISQDDIINKYCLEIYRKVYIKYNVCAISRDYYLYYKKINQPFRFWIWNENRKKKIEIISIKSDFYKIKNFIKTLDNLSATSFKNDNNVNFSRKDIWTSHVYTYLNLLKKNKKIAYVKEFMFYGTINNNQSRMKKAYLKSPIKDWILLFFKTLNHNKFSSLKKYLINDFVTKNFIGLIQIKVYGGSNFLLREIVYMIKYNFKNIFNIKFYFFCFLTFCVPSKILGYISDFFKFKIMLNYYKLLSKSVKPNNNINTV
jgi:glycosyltransferase involved in cell wall biosynthesis